jgi:hypothetical protein
MPQVQYRTCETWYRIFRRTTSPKILQQLVNILFVYNLSQRKKAPEADLVIIMGANLKVMPFAMIPELVHEEVPFVVINNHMT